MRLERRRENPWRITCYESMKLWWSSAVPTWAGSWTKERTWHRIDSSMDWHLACEMPWGSRWQSCLRGSKPAPALTCCTCWPRRWRHASLHIRTRERSRVLLILTGIGTGDILLPWDELQC